MSMTDPIADMLTRVRNALQAGKPTVDAPLSKVKISICQVLRDQGYIESFDVLEEPAPGILRITLKYHADQTPVLNGLRRVSKPSLRVYVRHDEIKLVRSGLGISIMSTPKGVVTGKQARAERLGGEVLCEVW